MSGRHRALTRRATTESLVEGGGCCAGDESLVHALLSSATAGPDVPATPRTHCTFIWNGRTCKGNELHTATLCNNCHRALALLEEDPEAGCSRFSYETLHKGKKQEGSGEAIHLAASRGHVELVEALLGHGAQLESTVTRGERPHYNVLHAAVFAEGNGGKKDMVQLLLQRRASLANNQDGRSPLHLAYQTGACHLIPLLQEAMEQRGIRLDRSLTSPLKAGIEFGKMSQAQLAETAPMTPDSLRDFIHHDPECIPRFLQRVAESGHQDIAYQKLAEHLGESDIARLFREAPDSAVALIYATTAKPECESPGWHPLPARASFLSTSLLGQLRQALNREDELFAYYEFDNTWRFNQVEFTYPEWHRQLDWTGGRRKKDVDVLVCHVPNIISAPFFASLARAAEVDNTLSFFESRVIRGSIRYIFWNGAIKVDLMQFFISLWSLAILLTETMVHSETMVNSDTKEDDPLPEISVSKDFIGAKGFLDLAHEVVQIAGCFAIGHPSDYVNVGNAMDIFRCCMLILLKTGLCARLVHVTVIFIYWCRLLEAITFAEKVASALLPITNLLKGLIPAFFVTLVGFFAFTHALYVARNRQEDPRSAVFESFKELILAGLPSEPPKDTLELALNYVSIVLFTIFFLNIFIGVIGEQYSLERQRSRLTFFQMRASSCLTFLLRVRILPCNLMARWAAEVVLLFTVLLLVSLQVLRLAVGWSLPYSCMVNFLLQVVMFMAAYQNPQAPWASPPNPKAPYYLWLAEAAEFT